LKGASCRRPTSSPAQTLRKIAQFQREQKKKNCKRAPKLTLTIDAMGGIGEYDWRPIPIGPIAEDAWIGKNREGASPLRRRIGRHVSCAMAIWYLPSFAAIHCHVDGQLLCTGVSCSSNDVFFTRSKAEILDRLLELLRKQAFTDDVIGPDGSFMAKLKTEIGGRMAHTKKEQVTDKGKFNAASHIRVPPRQQTWPPTVGARTRHAMPQHGGCRVNCSHQPTRPHRARGRGRLCFTRVKGL